MRAFFVCLFVSWERRYGTVSYITFRRNQVRGGERAGGGGGVNNTTIDSCLFNHAAVKTCFVNRAIVIALRDMPLVQISP